MGVLGGGKGSSPAPAPDYASLAQQQGAADKAAAQYNTGANRVNQYGPQGSITWSLRPGADPNNPQAGDYQQTTSLSPEQQALYNSQNRISQQYANTAEAGLGRLGNTLGTPMDTSGLPAIQGAPGSQSLTAQPGVSQMGINAQGLPELGGDYEASRKAVEQAYMARANTALDQNQAGTENRLLNSGIERGSEAWNREMNNLNQQRNDAQNQAILAGGQEQSRLANLAQQDRSQLYGEAANNATFANQAQGQQFAQQAQADQAYNALQERNAMMNNSARSQGLEEQAFLRSMPLNEINSLRTGAQVSSPQFSQYYTGGQTSGAPVFDAGVAQGNYNMQQNANNQSGQNAKLGGLAQLGSAFMGKG